MTGCPFFDILLSECLVQNHTNFVVIGATGGVITEKVGDMKRRLMGEGVAQRAMGESEAERTVVVQVTGTIGGNLPLDVKKMLIGMKFPATLATSDKGTVLQIDAALVHDRIRKASPRLHRAMIASDPRLLEIPTINLRPMWVKIEGQLR